MEQISQVIKKRKIEKKTKNSKIIKNSPSFNN